MTQPRVIIPHAGPLLEVQSEVLSSLHIKPEYVDVSGDKWDYWRLLSRLWDEREQFIILEHDMLPWPGALRQAWKCSEPWCVYPYLIGGVYSTVGHGCVKYSSEIMEKVPDAVENVSRRNWSTLDSHTIHAIRSAGFRPHVHQPPILHLNKRHYGNPRPMHVRRDGKLVTIDPVEWQLGWAPEAQSGNFMFNDDAAASAAARTVAVLSKD